MPQSVPQLLKLLAKNSALIEHLFVKRDAQVGLSYAQELARPHDIELLQQNRVITQSATNIELDESIRTYLEAALNTEDEIEIGNIVELVDELKSKIELFELTTEYQARQKHLKRIERILKKLPIMLSKSLNKLYMHIHLVYKSAKEHELKQKELSFYKQKLAHLIDVDTQINSALKEAQNFFKSASFAFATHYYYELKAYQTKLHISLIDLQRQVVDYINRVSCDTHFFKHIVHLKELKDSYEFTQRTNIYELLNQEKSPLSFTSKLHVHVPLDKNFAYSVEFEEFVLEHYRNEAQKHHTPHEAKAIDEKYLNATMQEEFVVDIHALHEAFAQSDDDLFNFVMQYDFAQDVAYEERLGYYCDLAGLYGAHYTLTQEYDRDAHNTYLLIYAPKEH